jgi:hypothetical protein
MPPAGRQGQTIGEGGQTPSQYEEGQRRGYRQPDEDATSEEEEDQFGKRPVQGTGQGFDTAQREGRRGDREGGAGSRGPGGENFPGDRGR